jgi:hypothetical protein
MAESTANLAMPGLPGACRMRLQKVMFAGAEDRFASGCADALAIQVHPTNASFEE